MLLILFNNLTSVNFLFLQLCMVSIDGVAELKIIGQDEFLP